MNEILNNLLKMIENLGFNAYFVGGCVRDYILNKFTNDIDIATNAPSDVLFNLFVQYKPKKFKYDSLKFQFNTYNIEIAHFRKEYDGDVILSDNIIDDFERRDFTINALYMDSNGKIFDYCNGLDDLLNRRIVIIGDYNKKFLEDPIRVLRCIRFMVEYNLSLNISISDFVHSNNFEFLEKERLLSELKKSFSSTFQEKIATEYLNCGIYDKIFINRCDVFSDDFYLFIYQTKLRINLPLSKKDKRILNDISSIVSNGKIDFFTLFEYGLDLNIICAKYWKIDSCNVVDMYNSLPIKNKTDLMINKIQIANILGSNIDVNVKKIYNNIISLVLSDKLTNKYNDLYRYVVSCKNEIR